jgi:hypothetical protein
MYGLVIFCSYKLGCDGRCKRLCTATFGSTTPKVIGIPNAGNIRKSDFQRQHAEGLKRVAQRQLRASAPRREGPWPGPFNQLSQ